MDFGVLCLDGLVGPQSSSNGAPPSHVSLPETKPKILGSVLTKQERSSGSAQDDLRASKMSKTDDFFVPKTMPLHQPATSLLRSNSFLSNTSCQQEHMLSFSLPKAEATPFLNKDGGLVERINTQNHSGFPYYQHTASVYSKGAGKQNFFFLKCILG